MNNQFSEIKELLPFEATFSLLEIGSVSPEIVNQLSKKEMSEFELCKSQKRQREFVSSRIALKKMAEEIGVGQEFEIRKDELGQPFGRSGSHTYFVSIAHTDQQVFCGLSKTNLIGIDLEPTARTVPDKLRQRITHPNEEKLVDDVPLIRLWTIKEAYIKLQGQGLRMNMNEVEISRKSEQVFEEINNDKRVKICSFRLNNNWLAIAYYH